MMRRRLGWCMVAALVASGCAAPGPRARTAVDDRTDVWFMQHMIPHVRQTTAIVHLTRDRISCPGLSRLADTISRQGQRHLQQLEGWLDRRGLAPHGHSHRPGARMEGDLARLSRVLGTRFDLVFLEVMAARHRAGISLALTEARRGRLPEVRQLARRQLSEHRAQVATITAWRLAWSGAEPCRPPPAVG